MRTAFYGINVIYIRVNVLRESGIIHDSQFNGDTLFLCVQVDYIIDQVIT